MPEHRGLLKIYDLARSPEVIIEEGQGARALFDLMQLSIVLETAGHYCGH